MKKITSILLLSCYLLTIGIVALNLHFCGGKLSSISFIWDEEEGKCGCSTSKPMKGCCQNEKLIAKVKDSHKISSFFAFKPLIEEIPIRNIFCFYTLSTEPPASGDLIFLPDPPDCWAEGIFIILRVLRI